MLKHLSPNCFYPIAPGNQHCRVGKKEKIMNDECKLLLYLQLVYSIVVSFEFSSQKKIKVLFLLFLQQFYAVVWSKDKHFLQYTSDGLAV